MFDNANAVQPSPQTETGRPQGRLAGIYGDLVAGIVVAILSLPMTIPLGVLALSPLGPDYRTAGVIAGFHSSIFAGFLSALTGGSALQISGPRASVSFIMASAIGLALKDPHLAALGLSKEAAALSVGFIVVFLAGLLQLLMGALKLGRAIKFVPYPVLSGFTNGVGALILLGQLPAALGLSGTLHWRTLADSMTQVLPGAVAVTACTILLMWGAPRVTKKVPPIIVGLVGGLVLDHLLRLAFGGAQLGPLVGPVDGGLPQPIVPWISSWNSDLLDVLLREMPTILVLALVGSMESLLSAATLDSIFRTHHDGNRELIGQGLGNMLGACFGGVPSTGAPARGLTSYKVGGRTRRAGMFHSLVLFLALIWGGALLASIPYSVMAGIMIMVGVSLMDGWILRLLRRGGLAFFWELVVVVAVAGISLFFDLAIAVGVGFSLAVFLFFKRMSQPIVRRRRVHDRSVGKSRYIRPSEVEKHLSGEDAKIIVINLDGPIFFGTAAFLRREFERVVESRPRVVILNAGAVSHIDLSGIRTLQDLSRLADEIGCEVMVSGIYPNAGRQIWLRKTGIGDFIPERHWFGNLSLAMEAAENLVAKQDGFDVTAPVAFAQMGLVKGLRPEEVAMIEGYLVEQSYQAGDVIFHKGDEGNGLYFIRSGQVDLVLPKTADRRFFRLATFGPGTFFGEISLLAGGTRSAEAIAKQDTQVWFMPKDKFFEFRARHTFPAAVFVGNIAAELGIRLRLSNTRLQVAE